MKMRLPSQLITEVIKSLKLNVSSKISEVIPNFKEQFNLSSVNGNILYGSYATIKDNEVAVILGSKLDKPTFQ